MEERMVSASQQWEDQTAEQSVRPLRLLDYIGQEDVKKGHHDKRSGFWTNGVTGNDRARMVDENGVVNKRANHRNFGVRNSHHNGMNVENFRGNHSIGRDHNTGLRATQTHRGQAASKIAKHVEAIDGVNESHVIIHGNDIVVAVDGNVQGGDKLLIPGHHYQRDEVIQFADVTGDSLQLAQVAQQNQSAEFIVFCGVHFMAETADMLTNHKQKVILPMYGS